MLLSLTMLLVAVLVASSSSATQPLVLRPERAYGVRPELLGFLDWWRIHGPFRITIGEHGGLRTSDTVQLALYLKGASDARTLRDTPHGRGAALDLYRVTRWTERGAVLEVALADHAAFGAIGAAAKAYGLAWGGDWQKPDEPHVQLPDWRSLPFQPVGTERVA